jgi:hypothetical protein
MPRKIKSYGRQDLIDVALPNHASTYTVISHKSVMDLSTEALEDAGFSVTAENYRATHDGNIASAIYTLNYGDDPELSMMFAWSNSYNKQMRFKCGVGAIHSVNNTSLVCGDMGSWARKHTGSADTETKETIEEQVKLAKMYYEQLVSDKEAMKKINLDVRKQSQILGMLFAEHDILTTEQASMIKQQMSRPTYKCSTPGTLWEFYNFVTIALQQSHPKTWMEDQRVLHWFISDTFKFDKVNATAATTSAEEETSEENKVNEATVDNKATVDTIPENSEEETKDPAQVDLEDMIAEVEAEEETTVQELVDKAVANPSDDTGEETVEPTIEEQRAEYWDQQTRVEEGLDHKGGLTNDELAADAEMQEMKTEEIIKEKIAEDEAAVAEVCDEVTDAEAAELIKGQEALDQQMAQEAAADNSVSDENIDDTLKGEPDFDLDFAPVADEEEDVDSGDVDFDFA